LGCWYGSLFLSSDEVTLLSDPYVSEVYSILTMINILLNKLASTESSNREILMTLLEHQFNYKVISSIREVNHDDLTIEYCTNCGRNHGVPPMILGTIENIKNKINNWKMHDS